MFNSCETEQNKASKSDTAFLSTGQNAICKLSLEYEQIHCSLRPFTERLAIPLSHLSGRAHFTYAKNVTV